MNLCVMIEGQEGVSWPQWAAIAAACEEHGVSELFRSDHYMPLDGFPERETLDAWATVSALAATTSRLRLGTLVSPATFRHPSNLAKLYASADQISGGRASLGLGAGWHAREHAAFGFPFGSVGERFDVFAEQLEIVRGLSSEGGPFSFSGRRYALDAVEAHPKPARPWLIVGGSAGRRSLALAARFADEYNTVFATAAECRSRRERWEAAWSRAGRTEPVRFSLMTGLLVGRDGAEVEDRRRLLAERRAEPSFRPGSPWLHGTVEQVHAQLAELSAAGVDRVMCQLLLHDDLDQIGIIGGALQT